MEAWGGHAVGHRAHSTASCSRGPRVIVSEQNAQHMHYALQAHVSHTAQMGNVLLSASLMEMENETIFPHILIDKKLITK